ncbi:MAG: hypothetical protein LBI35_04610 [Burkholderiales bacterium]|jgi:hypothetical protein|nr:hypothetical protein [Burkholderiales bacterium]
MAILSLMDKKKVVAPGKRKYRLLSGGSEIPNKCPDFSRRQNADGQIINRLYMAVAANAQK